jgi:hypothetical protein
MIAWSTTAKYEILLRNNDSFLALRALAFCLLSPTDCGFSLQCDLGVPAAVLACPPTPRGSLRIVKDGAVPIPSASAKVHTDPVPVFQF